MSTKVNLTKKIDGDRYCPVVVADNGRIKPDWVSVNGTPERHPEGRYYIDWTISGGRRRRKMVGRNAAQALAHKLRKETELKAASQGITVVSEDGSERLRLSDAIDLYLEETSLTKKPKTLSAYTTTLTYFRESCKKTYMADIDRNDLLRFSAYLRSEKSQSDRSVHNKFENLMAFLKIHDKNKIIFKNDRPKFVSANVEIYEKDELDTFFSACTPEERLLYEFYLKTGMREQEVIYSSWRDVKFKQGVVTMTKKPEYGWTPKGYKEREIPIPTNLMNALAAEHERRKYKKGLIFRTSGNAPKMDALHCLKAIVKRVGMDPADWWLHKFRATFATRHIDSGVSLRTVQEWLGHVDLESTMRYLRPARSSEVMDKVNATFG